MGSSVPISPPVTKLHTSPPPSSRVKNLPTFSPPPPARKSPTSPLFKKTHIRRPPPPSLKKLPTPPPSPPTYVAKLPTRPSPPPPVKKLPNRLPAPPLPAKTRTPAPSRAVSQTPTLPLYIYV